MEEKIKKLHISARRYCIDHYIYWTNKYNEIMKNGGDREEDGYNYTNKALDTFPRYNVLNAILAEIERFIPTDFETIQQAKDLLMVAGQTANSLFTEPPNEEIEIKAMNEEREKFCEFISNISEEDLINVDHLFYRRTLTRNESMTLDEELRKTWKISDSYWYPIEECKRNDVICFEDKYFEDEFGYENFRKILIEHGVENVYELREYGPEYEIELSIFEPYYNGAEGYWFTNKMDWIVYASHESSITIGGEWLVEQIKLRWTNWDERVWQYTI